MVDFNKIEKGDYVSVKFHGSQFTLWRKERYRIVKNDLGYYAQFKKWFMWYIIGEHNIAYGLFPVRTFGLYSKDHLNHPRTFEECEDIIKRHKEFLNIKTKLKTIKYY